MFKKKNYLEYKFKNGMFDNEELAEENIHHILEQSSPKSSCWWSSLKPKIYDFNGYFDYMRKIHNDLAFKQNIEPYKIINTAKKCPAILDVLLNCYLIKSPADVTISLSNDQQFQYNASNNLINFNSHPENHFLTEENNIFAGKMSLEIELPIYIRSKNVPFLLTQPMYHNNTWFEPAIGSLSTKYTKGLPLNINTFVDIPKDKETYEIKYGDVLAYLWFPERVDLKYQQTNFMESLFNRTWSVRSKFN